MCVCAKCTVPSMYIFKYIMIEYYDQSSIIATETLFYHKMMEPKYTHAAGIVKKKIKSMTEGSPSSLKSITEQF